MKNLYLCRVYCLRLTALLGALCAVAVFMYGGLLLMAVSHAAHISADQATGRMLARQVSALESTYLAQSAALTQELAQARGFVAPVEVTVVYASPAALTVNR